MVYSKEYKAQILERLKKESLAEIAEDTGISKNALYDWKKKANIKGERPVYSKEYKQEILERLKKESVVKISKDTGIKRNVLYNWRTKAGIKGKRERRHYSKEYKQEIVERLKKESLAEVAQDTGIEKSLLCNWRKINEKSKGEIEQAQEIEVSSTKKEQKVEKQQIKINYYLAGMNKYKEGKFRNSINYLEKALEQEENYIIVLMLGKCYEAIKDREKAEKLLIRVIQLDEDNIEARTELARLYTKQGKVKQAEQFYEEAIQLDKKNRIEEQNIDIRMELGRLYAKQGKAKQAQQLYKDALELKDQKKNGMLMTRKEQERIFSKMETIYQVLPEEIIETIHKIKEKYNLKMQDTSIRDKYQKKYDNLESLLAKSSSNKRAKLQIMVIMINEGYGEILKNNYPKEYEFVEGLIQEYRTKKIDNKMLKEKIDEYCM